jgi:multisubunit Na+/H+ antiporter MnhC subunit
MLLTMFGTGVILLLVIGLYAILTTHNLIRVLIGLEILTKGVTLLLITAGRVVGRVALAQALVITLIVVEVAVVVVAITIILRVYQHHDSIDTSLVKTLKG